MLLSRHVVKEWVYVNKNASISSDLPPIHPANDIFGFGAFAEKVADSMLAMSSPKGLVLAVNGPWGSGKTTLLNFVKHELAKQTGDSAPVVIDFNPWWFAGKEDLAPQIIEAFRRSLPSNLSGKAGKLGDSLSEYSDVISISASLATGGWLPKPVVGGLLKKLKKKEKLLPELKQEISEALGEQARKFIFIVDDIDRLSPAEVCDLLRVIKALGDFSNVIYLLSFDAPVVAKSITAHLHVDGSEYLEKIVQASFSIPAADRLKLRRWFFEKLDSITSTYGAAPLDHGYWASVYFNSLDKLIKTPRDIVRVTNSLAVTYPAVAGEVNIVDFVAIEMLRIFEPEAYEVIRESKEMFAGKASSDSPSTTAFHNSWMQKTGLSQECKALLAGIFPKFESAVTGGTVWSSGPTNWRKGLRIAHPDLFDIYFQFGVAEGAASQHLLAMLLSEASVASARASKVLLDASNVLRLPSGTQLEELLERVSDSDEVISEDSARGLLVAIFHVGERAFKREKFADHVEFLSIPERFRIRWAITSLINRMPVDSRVELLMTLVRDSVSPSVIVDCVDTISAVLKNDSNGEKEIAAYGHIVEDELERLKEAAVQRVGSLSGEILAEMRDADYVLNRVLRWSDLHTARRIFVPLLLSRQLRPKFAEGFLRFARSQSGGDPIQKKPGVITRDLTRLVDTLWLKVTFEESLVDAADDNQRMAINALLEGAGKDNPEVGQVD